MIRRMFHGVAIQLRILSRDMWWHIVYVVEKQIRSGQEDENGDKL